MSHFIKQEPPEWREGPAPFKEELWHTTEENKKFHASNTGQKGSTNGRALLKEEDVIEIRLRKKAGENWEKVYKDYEHTGIKKSSFYYTWCGNNWKHIIVD